jgi:hypothetical protein
VLASFFIIGVATGTYMTNDNHVLPWAAVMLLMCLTEQSSFIALILHRLKFKSAR